MINFECVAVVTKGNKFREHSKTVKADGTRGMKLVMEHCSLKTNCKNCSDFYTRARFIRKEVNRVADRLKIGVKLATSEELAEMFLPTTQIANLEAKRLE